MGRVDVAEKAVGEARAEVKLKTEEEQSRKQVKDLEKDNRDPL